MGMNHVPHGAINTLMQWVYKRGKRVRGLTTWPQPTGWMAHMELYDTPPLHARITTRGWRFTVTRVRKEPDCPVCSGQKVPAGLTAAGPTRSAASLEGFGGY
jgi:hypothetical protein